MRIIKTPPTFPNFNGYNSILKTLWKRGKLKTVVYGLYGDVLSKSNISLEHLKPHSQGGKTALSNLALASKEKNNFRNSKPIKDFLTSEMVESYLNQFKDIHARGFSGNKYIEMLRKTFKELLN